MIGGKKILGIIPARGGSKAVPGKNLKDLGGKPLIAWTIEQAQRSLCLDRIILSSDNAAIIVAARQWGCEVPFVRPRELAGDESPSIYLIIHAIQSLREAFDYIVLLQPTSPLRSSGDIDACLSLCVSKKAPFCVSVSRASQHPRWMHSIDEKGRLAPFLTGGASVHQRQQLSPLFVENGAIYAARTECLLQNRGFFNEETLAYVMPPERSVDIDDEFDFLYCAFLLKRHLENYAEKG